MDSREKLDELMRRALEPREFPAEIKLEMHDYADGEPEEAPRLLDDVFVTERDGQIVVSSLEIAERFEKRHDHVLRDIETIIRGLLKIEQTPRSDAAGGLPKFGETPGKAENLFFKTTYTHAQNGQEYPAYLMNRDGFALLAMGFTGEKALAWKLKYIEAFNRMEQRIRSGQAALTDAQLDERVRASLLRVLAEGLGAGSTEIKKKGGKKRKRSKTLERRMQTAAAERRGRKVDMMHFTTYSDEELGDLYVTEVNGEPWFILSDLADVLRQVNTREAARRHLKDDPSRLILVIREDGTVCPYPRTIVSYRVVLKMLDCSLSRYAMPVREWIEEEILPLYPMNDDM